MRIETKQAAQSVQGYTPSRANLAWLHEMERAQAQQWFLTSCNDKREQLAEFSTKASPLHTVDAYSLVHSSPADGHTGRTRLEANAIRMDANRLDTNSPYTGKSSDHQVDSALQSGWAAIHEPTCGTNCITQPNWKPWQLLGASSPGWVGHKQFELEQPTRDAVPTMPSAVPALSNHDQVLVNPSPCGTLRPSSASVQAAVDIYTESRTAALQAVRHLLRRTIGASESLTFHWHGERLVLEFQNLSKTNTLPLEALLPPLVGALRSHGIRDVQIRVAGRVVLYAQRSHQAYATPRASEPDTLGQVLNHV